ncbi:hypothetical protein X777_11586 [Ooceraea biroi]|uniref:Uncharacterized protein n=1 Tax=Ooceraea biroi TaxID=2015173 RepID=A0A026W536_OOCBI|nr:hypothetical protein X777_11586 [Ooceraea biroi]
MQHALEDTHFDNLEEVRKFVDEWIEGERAPGEAGISYLQLATLRLSGRFSSSAIPTPLFVRRNLINARKRTNSVDRGTAAIPSSKTETGSRLAFGCPKGSGWEPIFPRGRNKVEGEAEEGVVVSSVSACGRRGGCGQSRGRMGWADTDGTDGTIPSIEVSIYLGVSAEALKPRTSNLPVRLKLLSSYPWRGAPGAPRYGVNGERLAEVAVLLVDRLDRSSVRLIFDLEDPLGFFHGAILGGDAKFRRASVWSSRRPVVARANLQGVLRARLALEKIKRSSREKSADDNSATVGLFQILEPTRCRR